MAWDNLRRDVNVRIDILERIASGQVENLPEHARQALLRVIVDPCLRKLAELVIAIEIDDETLAKLADGRDPDAGMNDTDAGMNDTDAGMNDPDAGMNDTAAGMNDTAAGMNDTAAGMNDTDPGIEN